MSEMVDRVAKAVHEHGQSARALQHGYSWDQADESEKEYARGYARVAIAALRDALLTEEAVTRALLAYAMAPFENRRNREKPNLGPMYKALDAALAELV